MTRRQRGKNCRWNLRNGLVSAHEDLGIVLVKGTLVVGDGRHVLDDDTVVGVLVLLVQDRVGLDHVVDDVGLGNLLGAELLLGGQVLAVVVAEMVVAGNGGQLDTGADEEIDEGRLHLGLAGLEVVTTNVGIVLLGQLDGTRDKGVLGRAVDEGGLFQNTSDGKDGGRGDLLVTLLNGLEEVVRGVVDAGDDVGVALGVGSPHDNDLVEAVVLLELTDVTAELLDVSHAGLGALENVVGTVLLVGGDEVRVVDRGEGDHVGHLLLDLRLEGRLEDLGAVHGLGQVHLANVPAANDDVVGVDHGQDVVEGDVDVLVGLGVGAELEGGGHDDGAVVVGLAGALLGLPAEVAAVGKDTGGDGGAVVAAPADQHHADLGDLAVRLELVRGLLGRRDKVAIGISLYAGGAVGVVGLDVGVSVGDVGRVDGKGGCGSGTSSVSVGASRPVRGTVGSFSVGSHLGGCRALGLKQKLGLGKGDLFS